MGIALKHIVGSILGTFSCLVLGSIWYNVLDEFYRSHSTRRFEDTYFWMLCLGLFVICLCMSLLIEQLADVNKSVILEALIIGILTGVITGLGWNLITYAVVADGYDIHGSVVDGIFRLLELSVAGMTIGFIHIVWNRQ